MVVKEITLTDFRNYRNETFSLTPGVNIICGENAQGKTNLLEALYYLSAARSFRTSKKNEMIRFCEAGAVITADVESSGRQIKMRIELYANPQKAVFFVNGIRLRRNFEISEYLSCVLFSPDDLLLIKGGPAGRRDFLDDVILKLRPKYAAALYEYNRLFQHKTRILKDFEKTPALLDLLDDFSLQMCGAGAQLVYYRAAAAKALLREAEPIHRQISGGEKILLQYKTVENVPPQPEDVSQIKKCLIEHYKDHKSAEIASRACLSGPHKDDLLVSVDEKPARDFGSQGQIRTATLVLKLAECQLLFRDLGEYPILLLDDILSELDPNRQDFVLNRIGQGQVLISCCQADKLLKTIPGRSFKIAGGRIDAVSGE